MLFTSHQVCLDKYIKIYFPHCLSSAPPKVEQEAQKIEQDAPKIEKAKASFKIAAATIRVEKQAKTKVFPKVDVDLPPQPVANQSNKIAKPRPSTLAVALDPGAQSLRWLHQSKGSRGGALREEQALS